MAHAIKVDGDYCAMQTEKGEYRVFKNKKHVGFVRRDEYRQWQAHRVVGNLSMPVGIKRPKMWPTIKKEL